MITSLLLAFALVAQASEERQLPITDLPNKLSVITGCDSALWESYIATLQRLGNTPNDVIKHTAWVVTKTKDLHLNKSHPDIITHLVRNTDDSADALAKLWESKDAPAMMLSMQLRMYGAGREAALDLKQNLAACDLLARWASCKEGIAIVNSAYRRKYGKDLGTGEEGLNNILMGVLAIGGEFNKAQKENAAQQEPEAPAQEPEPVPAKSQPIVNMGGITYRIDGDYYYMIWSDHTVILHIPPDKANGIVSRGHGPNQVCIGGHFKFIKNIPGKNGFGADVNGELYEAVTSKELQPKIAPMGPLIPGPDTPEFKSLKSMRARIAHYNAEFSNSGNNGIRLRKLTDEAQAQLRACVGHTVTWEFLVESVKPARTEWRGHSGDVALPGMVYVTSRVYGLRLDREDQHQECLVIGQDISENYASTLNRGDTIRIAGVLTACEFDSQYVGHHACGMHIRIGNAVAVEPNSSPSTRTLPESTSTPSQAHEARKARAAYLIEYITRTGNAIDLLVAHSDNPRNYWRAIIECQNELLNIYKIELRNACSLNDEGSINILKANIDKITSGREFAWNAIKNCR